MSRRTFQLLFTIYISITALIAIVKLSNGHAWFNQWFFDKFFVFQFVSVMIIGLVIEGGYLHNLSYIRLGSRREILRIELLRYYKQGFIYLNIMYTFIVLGALLLKENNYIVQLIDFYIRYLLGIILFINIMSCMKWSKNYILSKYCKIFTLLMMTVDLLLLKPYVSKFFLLEINLIFSWVFYTGLVSYPIILILIVLTALLNIWFSDKRDFL